ncbi:MAG: EamA family transporter [Pseudomonadota bacterium]
MLIRDMAIALLVAFIWGANFTVIEVGLEEFSPLLFAALRFAAVAMYALLFLRWPKGSVSSVIAFGVLMGVLQFGLLFFAMDGHADAGTSALLIQAQVPLTMLISMALFREKVSARQWWGVLVCGAGLSLVFVGQEGRIDAFGFTLVSLAALSFAGGNLVMRHSSTISGFQLVAWSSLIPPIPLLALSVATESLNPIETMASATGAAWLALGFVALFATLIGFGLWGRLLSSHSPAKVLPFAMSVPLFAQLVAALALDEPFGIRELTSMVVVFTGALLCQRRPVMQECVAERPTPPGGRHVTPITPAKCCSRI